jgi:hypothetical protein
LQEKSGRAGRLWPRCPPRPLLWVLQVVGSNPAAPTKYYKDFNILGLRTDAEKFSLQKSRHRVDTLLFSPVEFQKNPSSDELPSPLDNPSSNNGRTLK